jgi:hypothetical protein
MAETVLPMHMGGSPCVQPPIIRPYIFVGALSAPVKAQRGAEVLVFKLGRFNTPGYIPSIQLLRWLQGVGSKLVSARLIAVSCPTRTYL